MQRGGHWHPSSAPVCAPAAKGLRTRDKPRVRDSHHPSTAHGDWGAPLPLIPSASCSEAQEKFMTDTAPA